MLVVLWHIGYKNDIYSLMEARIASLQILLFFSVAFSCSNWYYKSASFFMMLLSLAITKKLCKISHCCYIAFFVRLKMTFCTLVHFWSSTINARISAQLQISTPLQINTPPKAKKKLTSAPSPPPPPASNKRPPPFPKKVLITVLNVVRYKLHYWM